ncbi:MAG: hypothetical protein BMS9Abin03_173 [Thermodesulfobacteriota bacterium]|nr:MAG: hypothetical protein BMS9Abin03_173 [Thermodesulfobacteriota bacterium]
MRTILWRVVRTASRVVLKAAMVSTQRTLDKQIVAEYPFKVKGSHRSKKQAALEALAEAGLEAGRELSKMILKKETMK